MDGLTVGGARQFVQTGTTGDITSQKSSTAQLNPSSEKVPGQSFSATLNDAIHAVNDLQKNSDNMAQKLATGKTDNVADVMIAAEKADIALKLMVQVRNKIIDAYQEVMKMQV